MNGNHPSGPGTGPDSSHPNASAGTVRSRPEASGPELFRPSLSPLSMPEPPKAELTKAELTNLVRVPFGMRRPKRQRPQRPDHWATVVIPFQLGSDPTPPPQAA
jgi:hypothetical protein